jgi:hypothetical protein
MSLLKIVIFGLLGLPAGAWQAQNSAYSISVIEGQGAWNNVQAQSARSPVIQIGDRNHRPVAGAYVEFDTPNSGAGALFPNGTTHYSVTTNADGMATAAGLRNNGIAGSFVISIHVSFEGQSIGEVAVRQVNVARKIAKLSNDVQSGASPSQVDTLLPPNVLGIALGDQFHVNGSPTPSNANLFNGVRLQTQGTAVTIFLHDKCEFLIGPNSSIVLDEHLVHVENGAVRAKHFGNCKMGYAALWIQGVQPNSDAVLTLTGSSMEVASVTGQVQVANTAGEIINTVGSGSVATFAATPVTSGASAGGSPRLSRRTSVLIGAGVAASLAGLGLAVDSALQTSPTSP